MRKRKPDKPILHVEKKYLVVNHNKRRVEAFNTRRQAMMYIQARKEKYERSMEIYKEQLLKKYGK